MYTKPNVAPQLCSYEKYYICTLCVTQNMADIFFIKKRIPIKQIA